MPEKDGALTTVGLVDLIRRAVRAEIAEGPYEARKHWNKLVREIQDRSLAVTIRE